MRIAGLGIVMVACATLAGCGDPSGPPLVSAQFPPGMGAASEPQPINSLPLGAANDSAAPGATHPNYLARTFGVR